MQAAIALVDHGKWGQMAIAKAASGISRRLPAANCKI
jgi:hypothetical protein